MWVFVAIALPALFLSYFGVDRFRQFALRFQILDIPNQRSSHTQPVPRGGGAIIVFVLGIGLAVLWFIHPEWFVPHFIAYVIGATSITIVSGVDDIHPLPNWLRLFVHFGGAFIVLFFFDYWDTFPLPFVGSVNIGWLGFPLTFIWIVGLTNAYNFIDGIDGLSSGVAIIIGLAWAIAGSLLAQPIFISIGLLLACSCLGFLGHNWSPARVFMGDVGSAFLGYTFAVLPLFGYQVGERMILMAVLFLWPFIFDTAFTFFRRLFNGQNVLTPHRSHLYQRLVIVGYSHSFVTKLYMGFTCLTVGLGFLWLESVPYSDVLVAVFIPLFSLGFWLWVRYMERNRVVS